MKLTCPSCAAKINSAKALAPGVKVKCPKCGKPFQVKPAPPSSKAAPPKSSVSKRSNVPPPSSVPPPDLTPPESAPVVSTRYGRKRRAKSGAAKWVVLSVALMVLIAGGAIFFVMQSQPADDPKDNSLSKDGPVPLVKAPIPKKPTDDKKSDGKKSKPKIDLPIAKKPPKPKPVPKGEWPPFSHPTAGYTAQFPTKPKETTEKLGKLIFYINEANVADNESYAVTHNTVPDDVLKKGVDVHLNNLAEDFSNARQRLRFIQLGAIPGIEVEWKQKNKGKVIASIERYYIVDKKVYQITAKYLDGKLDSEKAAKFLDSFQLLTKPNQKVTDRRKGETPAPVATRFDDLKVISRVAFSPKGNFLVTFGGSKADQQIVTIWKYPSKIMLRSVENPPVHVDRLAISPDEKQLAAVGAGNLHVWTSHDGRKVHTAALGKKPSEKPAWLLEYSPDGKQIVTVNEVAGVAFDVGAGKIKTHQPHLNKQPATFTYCPKLHIAALIYHDPKTKQNPLTIWELTKGASTTIERLEQPVASAAFSRDGSMFAASYFQDEPFIILRKPGPATAKKSWPALQHIVVSTAGFRHYNPLILSYDGKHLAGVPQFAKPAPAKLHLRDVTAPSGVFIIDCPGLTDVVLAPDGVTLALTFDKGGLQFINMKNGAKVAEPGPPAVLIAKNPKKPTPPKTPAPPKALVMKLKKTWKPFAPPKSSITVLAPTTPVLVGSGGVNEMIVYATKPLPKDPAEVALHIAYQPTPEGFRKKTDKEQLHKIEEFIQAEIGLGTMVVRRDPIAVGGRKGREIVVKKGDQHIYHGRLFIADTQWAAIWMTQAEKQDDLVARKVFFDSIQFGKAPPLPKKFDPIAGWITFAPPKAGYSVRLPTKPTQTKRGKEKGLGEFSATDVQSQIPFYVRAMPIPKAYQKEDVKTQYQTIGRLLLGKVDYKSIDDKDVKLGKRLGRELVVSVGKKQLYLRMFATERLWLIFQAITPPVNERPIKVEAFFKSIAVP